MAEAGPNPTKTLREALRKRYAIASLDRHLNLLSPVSGDALVASFRDFQHVWYFGIFQDLTNALLKQMHGELKQEFFQRVACYKWSPILCDPYLTFLL